MNPTGLYQNNIIDLPSLSKERYERIFKVYKLLTKDNKCFYFYNILKKVNIPDTLEESLFDNLNLNRKLPWTTLSYKLYGNIYLWWLIFLINKPDNIFVAEAGTTIKYVKPEYIELVLDNIEQQTDL